MTPVIISWNKFNNAYIFTRSLQTEAITEGFETDVTAKQILLQLANVSEPVSDNSTRPNEIYGRDLSISVDILARLADYNSNQGNVSSTKDVNNYAQVASNLLDLTNSKTWQNLERVSQFFFV